MSNVDNSKYWDIDDVLAEEEKINCKFTEGSYQNSSLDPNLPPNLDIEKDAAMEIPLWLALALARPGIVEIEIPRFYKEQFKNTLEAGPNVINLRDKTPYYYEVGMKLVEYIGDNELMKLLANVFLIRMKQLANISFHLRIEDCSGLLRRMVDIEVRIFNFGREAALNYRSYKEKGRNEVGYEETFRKLKKIKAN